MGRRLGRKALNQEQETMFNELTVWESIEEYRKAKQDRDYFWKGEARQHLVYALSRSHKDVAPRGRGSKSARRFQEAFRRFVAREARA